MRLAVVSPFDPLPAAHGPRGAHVGGVERALWETSQRLARRGHEVTLVCSSTAAAEPSHRDGLWIVRVPRRATLWRAPLAPLARHIPPDAQAVHVPATYPFATGSALGWAHRRNVPAVLDFHFEPVVPGALGSLAAALYRAWAPRRYRTAARVVVRSLEYGRAAPSLHHVPEDRWRVVPNGFDPDRFHPDGPRLHQGGLLFVGRLVPYKGLDVLLQALALGPLDVPLIVAGDGPQRARLEALARRLKVDARFLGHVPDPALPALYRGARLTVLPSINRQEAFGITLIESMASGTPVVASDLPGVRDVARVGGRTAPPGDPQALASVLARALRPGALPRGATLARKAGASYSWDAVAQRLEAIYTDLIHTPDISSAPLASAWARSAE